MVPRVSICQVGFIPCSGAGHLCWLNDEALLIGWDQELGTDKTSDNIRLFIYGAQNIFMFVHKKCIHSIHIHKFVCVKMQVAFADFAREKNNIFTAGSTAGGGETDGWWSGRALCKSGAKAASTRRSGSATSSAGHLVNRYKLYSKWWIFKLAVAGRQLQMLLWQLQLLHSRPPILIVRMGLSESLSHWRVQGISSPGQRVSKDAPKSIVAEDNALAPCPKDLMAALVRWPKKAKPTAALMASLQRVRLCSDRASSASNF